MIEHLPNLLIAWGIQATGVLSPGPAVAMLLGVGLSEGRRAALVTTLGIGTGAVLLASATVIGLAAILVEVQPLLIAVKIMGACYLLWLAWGAFRKAAAPPAPPEARATEMRTSFGGQMLRGFLFQMSNPKAILYWIAVAAVGSLETVSVPALVLFLIGAFTISVLGHGAWGVFLSSAPFRAAYARARRWIEATLGVFFTFAAFKIATSET